MGQVFYIKQQLVKALRQESDRINRRGGAEVKFVRTYTERERGKVKTIDKGQVMLAYQW